jgi:hypothetical protein
MEDIIVTCVMFRLVKDNPVLELAGEKNLIAQILVGPGRKATHL